MRRMDRYKDEDNQISRYARNQELYQNYLTNPVYANISDITNNNAYDISNNRNPEDVYKTREAYQQMQRYQNTEDIPQTKKELDDFNYLYQKKDNKVYDINSVLEEARKNRQEKDEKEEKRRLKNNDYNILSGINKQELEKYREEKRKRLTASEEEIRDLIDTIASKTLAGEIDKATSVNLLSDLMATSVMDKVEASNDLPEDEEPEEKEEEIDPKLILSKEIIDTAEEQEKKEETDEKTEEKDLDFYTRSMDLSEKDFNLSDDFKEKPLPIGIKILIAIIILAVVAITGYFIYQKII